MGLRAWKLDIFALMVDSMVVRVESLGSGCFCVDGGLDGDQNRESWKWMLGLTSNGLRSAKMLLLGGADA